jgi:spermidine synthase
MSETKSHSWFHDYLSPHESHVHGIKSTIYSRQSPFQQIEILETESYGRCLILDGKMQSSETDEFIYHEALVHPALLTHPNPRRGFIVGGGEGATLREMLRYRSMEHVLMVDIDEEVVSSCRTHLPEWHRGAFDDPRTELRYCDARKYLEETTDVYDIIIIDISEPVEEGPAYLLYTREFYRMVMERLTPNGLIALQAGTTSLTNLLNLSAVYQTLRTAFPVVCPYQAIIPSFGLPWGFILASKSEDPRQIPAAKIDTRIAQRIEGDLRYYDGQMHGGQFILPKHVRIQMEKEERIIEDNQPLFTYN